MALWRPSEISPARWFDFSLASSVTEVSGDVSQINDLSGNGGHLSQSDNTKRPAYTAAAQNGLNVGTFDGVDEFLQLGSDFALGTSHSIFVAWIPASTITSATTYQQLLGGGTYTWPSTTTSEFLLGVGSVTGTLTNERISSLIVGWAAPAQGVYGTAQTSSDISGGTIVAQRFTTTGDVFSGRINGSASFASTATTGAFQGSNTRYPTLLRFLGCRAGSTNFFNGQIWEVVVFSSSLSLANTELMEGYLAWKWGVNSSLPIGHPYYGAAPTVPGRARRKINDGLFNRGLFNTGLAR